MLHRCEDVVKLGVHGERPGLRVQGGSRVSRGNKIGSSIMTLVITWVPYETSEDKLCANWVFNSEVNG